MAVNHADTAVSYRQPLFPFMLKKSSSWGLILIKVTLINGFAQITDEADSFLDLAEL